MTTTKRLFLAGGFALLAGIALMTVLHQFASRLFGAGLANGVWMHQGMPMPHEMFWWMPLGPLAMLLALGGFAVLIVSFVRLAARHR